MAESYDAIVIGAGHNGLTCACYLAKAGLKVLVLDQYHTVGGMATTEEITLPGFKSDIHAFGYQFASLSPAPKELDLASFGFELIRPEINYSHIFPDGGIITMYKSVEDTIKSIERYSKKDGETWRYWAERFVQQKDMIADWMNSPPASLSESTNQLAGMPEGMDEYRFEMQTMRSWVNEHFESEETRLLLGSLASHCAVSPDDVGGGHLVWLFTSLIQHFGNRVVKGGMQNLPFALAAYLRSKGGQIRTNARVNKIVVKNGKAEKVRLTSGEEIGFSKIVSVNTDPRQLLVDFLGEEHVGSELIQKIQQYEWGDGYMTIFLALDKPPTYRSGSVAGMSPYAHSSAPSLEQLSKTYTECRSGLLPAEPFIIFCNDSAIDPGRSPNGKAVMKIIILNVPYEITGDATGKILARNWDEVKEAYADHIIDIITKFYIPDLRDLILKRVVQSPVDMEREIPSAVRGTVSHGAFLPYESGSQRPLPGIGQYQMPVPNVFLCGSGAHPGGGITMAPGRNAALAIIKQLKSN